MDKIKAFFKNKAVRITCSCAVVLGTVGLVVGGVSKEAIDGIVVAAVAAVAAVGAVITIISNLIKE